MGIEPSLNKEYVVFYFNRCLYKPKFLDRLLKRTPNYVMEVEGLNQTFLFDRREIDKNYQYIIRICSLLRRDNSPIPLYELYTDMSGRRWGSGADVEDACLLMIAAGIGCWNRSPNHPELEPPGRFHFFSSRVSTERFSK